MAHPLVTPLAQLKQRDLLKRNKQRRPRLMELLEPRRLYAAGDLDPTFNNGQIKDVSLGVVGLDGGDFLLEGGERRRNDLGERRQVCRRGVLLCLLRRHLAGSEPIDHPDPGCEVVPVAGLEREDAQVQTTTLVFVMAFATVSIEEISRLPGQSLVG